MTKYWLSSLSANYQISEDNIYLLREAENIVDSHYKKSYFVKKCLEFSFSGNSFNKLRYALDIRNLPKAGKRQLLELYFSKLTCFEFRKEAPNKKIKHKINDDFIQNIGGIGVDQSFKGPVNGIKIYRQGEDNFNLLISRLKEKDKAFLKFIHNVILNYYPQWKMKFFGVDYMPDGKNRFKAYYPLNDNGNPLEMSVVLKILYKLNWDFDPDVFAKIAFYLINGSKIIHPTAFSLGFAIGDKSSLKLEIVPQAYFADSVACMSNIISLMLSLNLNPEPHIQGFNLLHKINPYNKYPDVEVICIDFYKNKTNTITTYMKF